jgi:peptide/nickel transport system permease protein
MTELKTTGAFPAAPRLSRLGARVGHTGLLTGGAIVAFWFLVALLAPVLAPHPPFDQDLSARLVRPVFMGGGWDYPLGRDHLGRDELSRLLHGARTSLLVGFGTILCSALIGVSLGLAAGFFGGRVDTAVLFLLNIRLSLPIMLAAIALVGLLGNSLWLMMLILALFLWDQFLVVTRALTMRLREADYVLAAKSAGFSDRAILAREILPNIAGPLLIVATLEMAHAIMLESALSFLGLGIRPPLASWGLMMAESKEAIFFDPWLVNLPGLAILSLVAGITLLGEGLRGLIERGGQG